MAYPLKQDSGKEPWQYKAVESLARGLNISVREDQLEDSELLRAKNVLALKEQLQVDTGYLEFAPGQTLLGISQATYQFTRSTGISELLLITTATVYKFIEGSNRWHFLHSLTTSVLTQETMAADDNTVLISDATAVGVGSFVGIIMDNGQEHQSPITAKTGNTITIQDPIPTGRSVANGATVTIPVALTGTLDSHVVATNIPSHDWFVFTNGENVVKRYDGQNCINVPNLPGSGQIICKAVANYNNCLFLINTIEDGTARPRRLRRSDSADPTRWSGGIAGFDDLLDSEDPLQGAELLGPYLIVYAEREIIRGEFIGTGGINFRFDTMVRGEGALSSLSIADVGDVHLVMMQSNIYAYRGGFDLEPIGDPVYYRLFGSRADMIPDLKHRCFAFYVEELDEVWFFYPAIGAVEGCNRMLRYNVGEKSWTEREFLDEFVGFGFFQSRGSRPWLSLVGSWLQQTWRWNDRTLTTNAPTTHLCPTTEGGPVMEYDYNTTLDNGTPIPYIVETKDFLDPDVVNRFDLIEMGLRGTDVLVEASTDGGLSWTTLGLVSSNIQQRVQVFKQFLFGKIRFRWSGSGPFELRWFGFSYKEEGLR